jgi:hypothetical protein
MRKGEDLYQQRAKTKKIVITDVVYMNKEEIDEKEKLLFRFLILKNEEVLKKKKNIKHFKKSL